MATYNKILTDNVCFIDRHNKCYLYFDGVDDYILLSNITLNFGTGPMSVALWVKYPETTTGVSIILGAGTATNAYWIVQANHANKFYYYPYSNVVSPITSSIVVDDNEWHFIVCVRNGTNGKIYVDGIEAGSGTSAQYNTDGTVPIKISNENNFAGLIADVRIYNRALTLAEIKSEMYRYSIPNSNCKGMWRWDDMQGYDTKKTFDLSGNNNTGTHTGTSNGNSNPPILMQPIYAGD